MRLPGGHWLRRLAWLAGSLWPLIGSAHDARPLSITMIEQTTGVYRVVVRIPPTIEAANFPRVQWPEQCELVSGSEPGPGQNGIALVNCPGGLATRRIRIDYPFYNPSITTLVRLQTMDGYLLSAVLPPDELEWVAPAEPTLASVAFDYLRLGFGHIWAGPDHLLFVAGLLLLARLPRRIFWAITGFTVAHSITLSLASLGLVSVAVTPVEAMIALSIVFLASEIARGDAASFSRRFPVVLSFVFGLLHGFGFASALGEVGLPRNEVAAGLLFFNVGVEIGQLAFIGLIIGAVTTYRFAAPKAWRWGNLHAAQVSLAGAYCLGIPGAFWFFERSTLALGL